MNRSDAILVRDRESFEFASKISGATENLKQSADCVLTHTPDSLEKISEDIVNIESGRKVVLLHLPGSTKDQHARKILFNSVVERMAERVEWQMVVLSDNPDSESSDYLDWASECRSSIAVIRGESLGEVIGSIRAATTVITTKLHVGIVSTVLSKQVVSFYKHPKTRRFFSQIGYPDSCIPLSEVSSENVGTILDDVISGRYPNLMVSDDVKERAYENLRALCNFEVC